MDILNNHNFQLIKRDLRDLRSNLFGVNNINDWDKIIIIYNIFLIYNQMLITYTLLNALTNNNATFSEQFRTIYLFFFILCSVKSSYLYFIYNVSKVDYELSMRMHSNFKNYF